MKKEIHPKYVDAVITCACGETIHTRSTKKEIKVGVCSKCHPFFTGTQKFLDTAGRVERFMKKYAGVKKKTKKVRRAPSKAEEAGTTAPPAAGKTVETPAPEKTVETAPPVKAEKEEAAPETAPEQSNVTAEEKVEENPAPAASEPGERVPGAATPSSPAEEDAGAAATEGPSIPAPETPEQVAGSEEEPQAVPAEEKNEKPPKSAADVPTPVEESPEAESPGRES